MRKTVPMSFGELWKEFLDSNPAAARKRAEARVAEVWPEVAGPLAASFTESISVVRGVMYVRITSSAARSEVFMRRSELADALNRAVGMVVVNVLIVK